MNEMLALIFLRLFFNRKALPRAAHRLAPRLPPSWHIREFTNGLVSKVRASKTNEHALLVVADVSAEKLPLSFVVVTHEENWLSVAKMS